LPSDLIFGSLEDGKFEVKDYADDLRRKLKIIHSEVRAKMKIESDRVKTRYDLKLNGRTFKEGELVWLFNPSRKKGLSPKLQRNWEGPYKVIKQINDLVYRIQRSPRTKMKVVHLDRLQPYISREDTSTSVRDEQA